MGVYIDHPKYENTRKPKILAHTRDKVVIHQNGVVWDQLQKITGAAISLCRRISLASENFVSLAKFHRDSEIGKFRYQQ